MNKTQMTNKVELYSVLGELIGWSDQIRQLYEDGATTTFECKRFVLRKGLIPDYYSAKRMFMVAQSGAEVLPFCYIDDHSFCYKNSVDSIADSVRVKCYKKVSEKFYEEFLETRFAW